MRKHHIFCKQLKHGSHVVNFWNELCAVHCRKSACNRTRKTKRDKNMYTSTFASIGAWHCTFATLKKRLSKVNTVFLSKFAVTRLAGFSTKLAHKCMRLNYRVPTPPEFSGLSKRCLTRDFKRMREPTTFDRSDKQHAMLSAIQKRLQWTRIYGKFWRTSGEN